MKSEFKKKYAKTWRVFIKIVQDFDQFSWLCTGRGVNVPARLALHILQSTAFYIQDQSARFLFSGRRFTDDCWEMAEKDLPSQGEIVSYVNEFKTKLETWLETNDLEAENFAFEWTGNTNFAVILFSFQHCLFHLGELSSLLNESRNGSVEDHYVNA